MSKQHWVYVADVAVLQKEGVPARRQIDRAPSWATLSPATGREATDWKSGRERGGPNGVRRTTYRACRRISGVTQRPLPFAEGGSSAHGSRLSGDRRSHATVLRESGVAVRFL
ncbi:hypothetical protein IscW_ISCW010277 [Ixodes scapularis]|uniref:Uncharacterized protein n=1 Tax=Ixodes scapularis TaxID=6945 RepID=B7Q3L6_IXOSC|nr:hypothetical protein IscW_ISCW010277 [Ixodes scapularis]|eukprot:XP_002411314.1 hypothetical protein IscW_ISCW010277 [Ixodes scapularis]